MFYEKQPNGCTSLQSHEKKHTKSMTTKIKVYTKIVAVKKLHTLYILFFSKENNNNKHLKRKKDFY